MSRVVRTIVIAGALVGVLDIAAAFVYRGLYGVPPLRVLQGIASGILGPAAFRGGWQSGALGLALHFLIACIVAAVYYGASRVLPVLIRRPMPCGLAYGVAVYVVMNAVVLPLSRVNFRTPPWSFVAVMIVIHMLFVGLPAALVIANSEKRYSGDAPAALPTV
jgi:hypothetical protein